MGGPLVGVEGAEVESQPEPIENFLDALLTVSWRCLVAFEERDEAWRRVRLYGFGGWAMGSPGEEGLVKDEAGDFGVNGGEYQGGGLLGSSGEVERLPAWFCRDEVVEDGEVGEPGRLISFGTTMRVRWRCLRMSLPET